MTAGKAKSAPLPESASSDRGTPCSAGRRRRRRRHSSHSGSSSHSGGGHPSQRTFHHWGQPHVEGRLVRQQLRLAQLASLHTE